MIIHLSEECVDALIQLCDELTPWGCNDRALLVIRKMIDKDEQFWEKIAGTLIKQKSHESKK